MKNETQNELVAELLEANRRAEERAEKLSADRKSQVAKETEKEDTAEFLKGLAQIGMGAAGLNSLKDKNSAGLDFSDTKLPDTDRSKRIKRIADQYDMDISEINRASKAARDSIRDRQTFSQADIANRRNQKLDSETIASQRTARETELINQRLEDPTSKQSTDLRNTLRALAGEELPVPDDMTGKDARTLIAMYTRQKAKAKTSGSGTGKEKDSEFFKNFDRNLGKTAKEDFEDIQKAESALASMETAYDVIEKNEDSAFLSDSPVGTGLRFLGSPGRKMANEELDTAFNTVQSVIAPNIKSILGAQFTEKEGEKIITLLTGDGVSPAETKRRWKNLMDNVRDSIEYRKAREAYLMENGTIRGFDLKKPVFPTIEDAIKRNGDKDKDKKPETFEFNGATYEKLPDGGARRIK